MSAATPTSPGFPLGVGSGTMMGLAGGPTSVSGSPRGASRPTTPLSAGAPPLGPTYDDVRKWDDAEIATWLQSARLGAHAATFVENDIRGSVLLDVDQAALKEMGIASVGDRVRIFAAIKALNKRCADSAALERRRRGSNSSLTASPRRIHISLPRGSDAYHDGLMQPDGEMEYLEYDNADLDRVDEAGELGGGALSKNSLGSRARQIRPPPLLLKQSASRGLPGHTSPVSTINNGQGFGLSAARGLTPGAGRGSLGSRAKPVHAKPGEALGSGGNGSGNNSSSNGGNGNGSGTVPGANGAGVHRKVNSIGTATMQGMGAAPAIAQNKVSGGGAAAALVGAGSGRGQGGQALASGRPSTATGAGAYGSLHSQGQGRSLLGSPSGGASSPTGTGFAQPARPSTAGGATSYGGGMASLAGSGQMGYPPLTPITEGSSSSYASTPSTSGGLQQQQQQQQQPSSSQSTPSNGYSVGRGPFAGSASRPITPGRDWPSMGLQHSGSIRRPETADAYGSNAPAPPTLEDLKRRTIKFISEEDRTTRTVNVSDCRDAYDVMSRVLKKFGKPASGNSYTPTADQGPTGDDLGAIETWGIFATSADGQNTKALSDNELLAICHAPQIHDPLRERGLTLRRIPNHLPGEDHKRAPPRSGRHKLEAFFGERMPVNQMTLAPPASPREPDSDAGSVTISGKKMKRASTVSIMSGLGVGPFNSSASRSERGNHPHGSNGNGSGSGSGTLRQKESAGTIKASQSPAVPAKPSKIRNFFGQRPPSELINTNLADFFPSTEPKALQRTARRSVYGRASASTRSKRNSTWSFSADPDAPPLPGKESLDVQRLSADDERTPSVSRDREGMPVIQIGFESRPEEIVQRKPAREGPPMLPPIVGRSSLEDWSKGLQAVGSPVMELAPTFPNKAGMRPNMSRRTSVESSRSRRSLASQVRHGLSAARDRSDAVSLLTVDEITQEVEQRRESMSLAGAGGGWVVDEDGVPIPIPGGSARSARSARSSSMAASTRPSSGVSSSVEEEDEHARPDSDLDETTSALVRRPSADAPRPSLSDPLVGNGGGGGVRAVPAPGAPGEEADRHMGDPMARARSTTSRASSVGELRRSLSGRASDHQLDASDLEGVVDGVDDDDDDFSDEEDFDDDDDDYDDDDNDDDDDDDDEELAKSDPNVSRTQPAHKTPIKWHKGALIGAGSFGNVFLGMNAKTGLLMAVKQVELPSGDSHLDQRKKGMLEALEREIKLLKTLQHDNIVQYLDSFADGTHLNIFLEYVPGGSIVALLRNYGAFEEPLVRNFVRQILQGLSFLHARDIVHRDIKGANILVDNKGGIKISDFGISKKVESDLLVSARAHRPSLQGSVFWMAPEVVKQTSYTRKADIWSLGCLVVEMISGTHPWAELNQMQALFQIGQSRKPSMPDEVSSSATDFLERTFELDHNCRPSADELLLHPFVAEEEGVGVVVEDEGTGEGEEGERGGRRGTVKRERRERRERERREERENGAAGSSAQAQAQIPTVVLEETERDGQEEEREG